MLSPMTPAPITTVFGRDDDAMVDAVISDSLRRAHPARFSGSDLSHPGSAAPAARAGGTPASRQFWAGALRMQGFSQSSLPARVNRRRGTTEYRTAQYRHGPALRKMVRRLLPSCFCNEFASKHLRCLLFGTKMGGLV